MKKLFLKILVGLGIIVVGLGLLVITASAQLGKTFRQTTQPEASIGQVNQGGGIFQPTQDEMKNGIHYVGEGVYIFSLTDQTDDSTPYETLPRNFALMLGNFKGAHRGLELEAAVGTESMKRSYSGYIVSRYTVSFKQKMVGGL